MHAPRSQVWSGSEHVTGTHAASSLRRTATVRPGETFASALLLTIAAEPRMPVATKVAVSGPFRFGNRIVHCTRAAGTKSFGKDILPPSAEMASI
jgi:hypothetical protein